MPPLAALPSSPATVIPTAAGPTAPPGTDPGTGTGSDPAIAAGFAGLLIAPLPATATLPGSAEAMDLAAPISMPPVATDLPTLVGKPAASTDDPELLALLAAIAGQGTAILPVDATSAAEPTTAPLPAGPSPTPSILVPTLAAVMTEATQPSAPAMPSAPPLPGQPPPAGAVRLMPSTEIPEATTPALTAVSPGGDPGPAVGTASPVEATSAAGAASATPEIGTLIAPNQPRPKVPLSGPVDTPVDAPAAAPAADTAGQTTATAVSPQPAGPLPEAVLRPEDTAPALLPSSDPTAEIVPLATAVTTPSPATTEPSTSPATPIAAPRAPIAAPRAPAASTASAIPTAPVSTTSTSTPVVATPDATGKTIEATPSIAANSSPIDDPVSESPRPAAEPTAPLTTTTPERPAPIQPAQRSEVTAGPSMRQPNPVERVVASQVARAVIRHLPDGGERLTLRLTPPELGTVRVEFLTRDGVMTARLVAEDDGVRQALERALPQLRSDLKGDHPQLDIHVDKGDQRWAWNEQQRGDQRGSQQGNAPHRRRDDEPAFSLDGILEPVATTTAQRADPILGGRVTRTLVDALA